MSTIVEVKDLVKYYGKGENTAAFDRWVGQTGRRKCPN